MTEKQYDNIMSLLIVIVGMTLVSGIICCVTILEINEMIHELIRRAK